jgi:hypothetical protein
LIVACADQQGKASKGFPLFFIAAVTRRCGAMVPKPRHRLGAGWVTDVDALPARRDLI